MNAKSLYKQLDSDFEVNRLRDDWSWMEFNEYYSETFRERFSGVVLDNAKEVTRVYTAMFPSDSVLKSIIDSGDIDVLLLTHHPFTWVSSEKNASFVAIPRDLLATLKEMRIALYTRHTPLDKVGPYSTSTALAEAIGVVPESTFCEYHGVHVGSIGRTPLSTLTEIAKKVESAVGHRIKVWDYEPDTIQNQRVAVVGGGDNISETIAEIVNAGLNTYVTGITKPNPRFPDTIKFHKTAEKEGVNIIAATHYSTEKFACIALLDYFEKLGLKGEFIEGKPLLTDYK